MAKKWQEKNIVEKWSTSLKAQMNDKEERWRFDIITKETLEMQKFFEWIWVHRNLSS